MAREQLLSPMPGVVIEIQVSAQAAIRKGQSLFVVEAMKMETEVRAARSGVVQDLHVKEGDSVAVGSPILSLA